MTTQSVSSSERTFAKAQRGRARLQHIVEIVLEWRRRATSRSELAALSALEIKDIGYPARAEAEKAKPFWRG
jgi:uncharacterized protein YjiS (DUF1127 family)